MSNIENVAKYLVRHFTPYKWDDLYEKRAFLMPHEISKEYWCEMAMAAIEAWEGDLS